MVTMPRSSGEESPPNIPNNTSTDTLPYFSPIAVRSHSPLTSVNRSTPLVQNIVNDSYTAEPIVMPNETETCDKSMIGMTTFHIIYAILALVFPITILIMNSIYGNDMKCYTNNSTFDHVNLVETIGLKTWLNVFGTMGIVNVVIYFATLFLFLCGNGYSLCMINIGLGVFFNYIIFSMFRFAWIIVGCFLFWRDCLGNSQLPEMNSLMRATLLISVILEPFVISIMIYNGYKIYKFVRESTN